MRKRLRKKLGKGEFGPFRRVPPPYSAAAESFPIVEKWLNAHRQQFAPYFASVRRAITGQLLRG